MEISELKQMLKKSTAVLILENGDPSLVVVDYKTYKDLLDGGSVQKPLERTEPRPVPPSPYPQASLAPQTGEMELLERINKDILALKEQIAEDEKALGL